MTVNVDARPWMGRLPQCVGSAVAARPLRRQKSIALDVGSHHGNFARGIVDELAFESVFAFEPHPANIEKLRSLSLKHPQIIASSSAVGAQVGEAWFSCNADDATGSVLDYAADRKTNPPAVHRKVPMVSLDTFCDDFADHDWDVRLMKIDTQGYDLAVLKGAEKVLMVHEPIVFLEFIYDTRYVNQAAPFDIECWMRAHGFRLTALTNIHVDASGALAFADAMFVPKSVSMPERSTCRQIDNEASWREQIATFERICAERLVVIETLDAEVNRLRQVAGQLL
jgi:FkbM family methyltransferase